MSTGWQTILRSKNIYGPYQKKVVLQQGSTDVNGPHQGALVDTPDGEWWFLHFQRTNNLGRVGHLQPVVWKNKWPEPGVDIDRNGIGEPVKVWTKPNVGKQCKIERPASSDEFNGESLGLQWRANHKFYRDNISFTKKPGHLTLTAMRGDSLKVARNTLVQKVMGYTGDAVIKLDMSKMADGQLAGLTAMAKRFMGVGVEKEGKKLYVYTEDNGIFVRHSQVKGSTIYFKVSLDAVNNSNQFYYSVDGKKFIPVGEPFELSFAFWKGPHIGIFSYNRAGDGGDAAFDWFRYTYN